MNSDSKKLFAFTFSSTDGDGVSQNRKYTEL